MKKNIYLHSPSVGDSTLFSILVAQVKSLSVISMIDGAGLSTLHVGASISTSGVGKIQMLSAHCKQITRCYYVRAHLRHRPYLARSSGLPLFSAQNSINRLQASSNKMLSVGCQLLM